MLIEMTLILFSCLFANSSCGATSSPTTSVVKSSTSISETHTNISQTSTTKSVEDRTVSHRMLGDGHTAGGETSNRTQDTTTTTAKSFDDEEPKLWSHSMKSSSTYSQLASQKPRQK